MKVSLNWLSEFVDLPETSVLIEQLIHLGLEVEEQIEYKIVNVVVGQITAIEKHPDADRLVICQLDIGDSDCVQIVTGATNVAVDDKVPVALHGAVLSGGFKIKKSKLRGIPSNGMLCSQKELGLGDEAKGIWILPADSPIGKDFAEHVDLNDTVLDLAILPNRGDCASVLGVAREVAAVNHTEIRVPKIDCEYALKSSAIQLSVEEPNACPLYQGHYLTGLTPEMTSPLWMQVKLLKAGIRSINLPVDISNFVCIELGQPSHTFDADALKGQCLTVKSLPSATESLGLDEQLRKLQTGDLVIHDAERVVALAGVMGSEAGSVTENTSALFLETAFFEPDTVRKQASYHRCHSESSFRFERFVDPEGVRNAAKRIVFLFQEIAGLKAAEPIEFFNAEHPDFQASEIEFSLEKIEEYSALKLDEGLKPLEALGFTVFENKVGVASWRRRDCRHWTDLAEEVLRLKGLESIQGVLPQTLCMPIQQDLKSFYLQNSLQFWVEKGFQQCQSFSFADPEYLNKLGLQASVMLANPMGAALSVMRPAIWPHLLSILSENLKHQNTAMALCEAGSVFVDEEKESLMIEGLLYGPMLSEAFLQSQGPKLSDISYLKGLMDQYFERFGFSYRVETDDLPSYLHPYAAAKIYLNDIEIGFFGQLHPKVQKAFALKEVPAIFQINLDTLPEQEIKEYQPFSSFPSIRCDLAFVADKALSFQAVSDQIDSLKDVLCVDYSIFDYYEGEALAGDQKSIGVSFKYQANDRTLTDEDVQPLHTHLCDELKARLPIQFR